MIYRSIKLIAVLALAVTWTFGSLVDRAVAEERLFEGKTVTFFVPFRAGGGTDRWTRFWATSIAKNLPGNPKISIKNITGGGSTKGANFYHNEASKDGLDLFVSSASVMYPYILGDSRVKYDYHSWEALIVSPTGGVVYAHPDFVDLGEPVTFKTDVEQKISVQGPTQVGVIMLLAFDLLDIPYSAVFGASGASEIFRNFRQGLVTVDMQTTASYIFNMKKLIEERKALPVFSLGTLTPEGVFERDPNFPNLPHFLEYYQQVKGEKPDGKLVDLWKQLFISGFPTQKMLLIDKNVPENYLKAFEKAIMETVSSSESWPNEHERILGDYPQYYGKEAQELLDKNLEIDFGQTEAIFKEWLEDSVKIKI